MAMEILIESANAISKYLAAISPKLISHRSVILAWYSVVPPMPSWLVPVWKYGTMTETCVLLHLMHAGYSL
jgi:hypothetical protein